MPDLYTLTSLANAAYTNTGNWVGGAAPTAADGVVFQFDATLTLSGSDQSGTELVDIEVLASCTGDAGSADTYLQLDQTAASGVVFAGGGTWYLDMGTAGSSLVRVDRTRSVSNGQSALYFKNNTNPITLFEVNGGNVRLVDANITTLVVGIGATAFIDSGCTIGTVQNDGGTIIDYGAAVTTWNQNAGTSTKTGSDAYAANVRGGVLYNDGTGTATAVVYGGIFDSLRDGQSKNVTLTMNGGTAKVGASVTLTDTLNAGVTISA